MKVCVSRVTASIAAVLSASIGDNRSVSFSATLTARLRHEPHAQQTLERLDLEPFAAGSQVHQPDGVHDGYTSKTRLDQRRMAGTVDERPLK